MARRMSCALTIDAVRYRTKTVTRRHVDTWVNLQAGDRLTLVEKAMGLPKGSRQVILAEVEVVDVRVELLDRLTDDELELEGFNPFYWTVPAWARWWAMGHGYGDSADLDVAAIPCRRIEWRYLDGEATS